MKVLKVLAVVAVLSALAVPASANNLNVIFDPLPPQPSGGGTGLYSLKTEGPFTVVWQACSIDNGPLPTGSTLVGDVACLGFANQTGANIYSLDLTFEATTANGLAGLTLNCMNDPGDTYLSTNNCSTIGTLTDGEWVTMNFMAPDFVPPNYDFYFGVTATDDEGNPINIPGMPDSTIALPTNDPSTLMLLASGIGLLALCAVRRRQEALLAS